MSATSRNRATANLVLVSVFLFAAAAAAESPQPTNPQPANPKPILIVWAHTDLPDQGAPSLDVVDLERYFATRLDSRRIINVEVSGTTKIPNPAPSNVYLLDLTIAALHPAYRAAWDGGHNAYVEDPVFSVELSLIVKHLQSGRVLGSTGERYEYHFQNNYEADRPEAKHGVIFTAADNLAERFVSELASARYGQELTSARTPSAIEQCAALLATAVVGVPLLPLLMWALPIASGLTLVPVLNKLVERRLRARTASRKEWDATLESAIALKLKTDDFSDAACRLAAMARRDAILAAHAEIEKKTAHRLCQSDEMESFYAKVARYAARRTNFNKEQMVGILRNADEWEFRVLQEAKRQATEFGK
jgi:hypothetical protein